jgi:histidyl-tRNA synthetase
MSKIKNISGFPELLPQEKIVEDKIISIIKGIYESYGFQCIETPAVELITTLAAKGVIDKEIYLLKRAKDDGEGSSESQLALHFDLTVPLARYVAQHYSSLVFPFKRYQLQKVWRGERPQKGRFREFYQFDIDIIAQDELPLSCDAEIVNVIGDVFVKLALGSFKIKINSRKLLFAAYEKFGLDTEQQKLAITAVDKIDKIGLQGVQAELLRGGISDNIASKILELTKIKAPLSNINEIFSLPELSDKALEIGKEELRTFSSLISSKVMPNVMLDVSLARGLDYYTGIIYEVVFDGFPEFGSVCSGGRYDDLASQFINKKLPGVGVSIGLSRLMELILSKNLFSIESLSKTKVLIAVYSEEQRPRCNEAANILRSEGVATEVYFKSPKIGKQIDFAAQRNIPFVLFLNDEKAVYEIKDLNTKEQKAIPDLREWANNLPSPDFSR